MSDRSEVPDFPPRALESPGLPERTGSHPITFVPAPFARRPVPSYPQRADYADLDPAFPRASFVMGPVPLASPCAKINCNGPAPIERRAGSEPHTGWRRQNIDVDIRRISIPPGLENASLTLRGRQPYPNRTMDEITTWMPPLIVKPRRYGSQPITEAERLAAGPSHRPNDWSEWPEENNPHRTRWVGHDRSRYAMNGGWEDPKETAAVPNEQVLESIEAEGDPLIALRQTASDSQTVIRRELERRVVLEDENRGLIGRNERVENDNEAHIMRNRYLERSRQDARNDLALVQQQRDILQKQLNLARSQAERLRMERDEPEEAYRRRQAQQQEFEHAIERIRDLEESEVSLRTELDLALTTVDRLRTERNRLENSREQLEMERDHYETERDRERSHNHTLRNQNHDLQQQVIYLVNQLQAAQAVAIPPVVVPRPVNTATVNAPHIVSPAVGLPRIHQHPILPSPVTAPSAGTLRGGRGRGRGGVRERGGRRGRVAAATRRKQPERTCKVVKGYRK